MNIKKYLPIIDKIALIEDIINWSFIEDENGYRKYDNLYKEVAFVYYIAKHYSDVEMLKIPNDEGIDIDDIIASYDMLVEKDIINEIYLEIPKSELDFIKKNLQEKVYSIQEDVVKENSFMEVIKNLIKDFQNNIPQMAESLKNFSPENYSKLNELLQYSKGETIDKVEK